MNRDKRDHIDDLFRSKLYDFESNALSDDIWDKIEGRLQTQRYTLPAASRWKWWTAAAAVITLLLVGGGFYFLQDKPIEPVIAHRIEQETENLKAMIREQETIPTQAETPVIAQTIKSNTRPATRKIVPVMNTQTTEVAVETYTNNEDRPEEQVVASEREETTATSRYSEDELRTTAPEVNQPATQSAPKRQSTKRWGLGVGAGSITAGSSNVADMYAFRNTSLENEQLDFLNSFNEATLAESPKTDIKHHQPISFGLSVSYRLAPKWYLTGGVNYSFLFSEWETNGSYWTDTEQSLHFIGIPISIVYQIAEWNKFMWYASAGFMPEINVAGRLKETKYLNDQQLTDPVKTSQRMKEWYWSVQAGTGVSYPLFWHFNAFAEVGASYYFDNGSKIETVHSDKPFNLNLSVGLRLGF